MRRFELTVRRNTIGLLQSLIARLRHHAVNALGMSKRSQRVLIRSFDALKEVGGNHVTFLHGRVAADEVFLAQGCG